MKTLSCFLFVASMLLAACSTDVDEQNPADEGRIARTAILQFEGNITNFDSQTTRATTSDWDDGARIYIQFETANGVVDGVAVYSQKTDEWTVHYFGTITQGQETMCEVYYFDNPVSMGSTSVELNPYSAVFADIEATYIYADGKVKLKARLKPLTGRIRFRGTPGYQFCVYGMKWYSYYDVVPNTFSQQNEVLTLTVGENGYTPYVYLQFVDAETRKWAVYDDAEEYKFTPRFDKPILATGKSGFLDVPTTESYIGWKVEQTNLDFTVTRNGVAATFRMIRVKRGTFQMGRAGSKDEVIPVHQVTLTNSYYVCETEVTQGLWYAVMGQSPTSDGSTWNSSYGQGDNYPAYFISYDDCQKFLTKLNQLTGQQFRFPTEAEWEFAAKGGTKSQEYTYAGSNTIGDVAWYKHNGGSTHPVKTKKANELGLYDMSGSVWEWCADWYGSYNSYAQTNPSGPTSGSNRMNRGGCWFSDYDGCHVTYRHNSSPWDRNKGLGFRLAL